MLYVLEATAIAEIFVVRPAADIAESLTLLIERNHATFPDDVIYELRAHYAGDSAYVWAVSVRAARAEPAVPWDEKKDVEEAVPEVIDPDNPREQCASAVLAQARALSDILDVSVVTEDYGTKPLGRMSIAQACETLGVKWMPAADFLRAVGL